MEHSKLMVIPVTLEGGNFLLRSRTTKTALCSRGLWSHIELQEEEDKSSDEEGEETAKKVKWFQEDQTVLALLQNSLDGPILEASSYCETAKELWDTLQNVYGNISNLSRVFEVKKAINDLTQEDLEC